jgi:hypothetical protein
MNPYLVQYRVQFTSLCEYTFVEEGIERCSQNYVHPQHENENVAHTTRSIARIWVYAQIAVVIAFHTALAQVVDMSALVLQ